MTPLTTPLHAVDRGQGPVLLLVHGFPLDHSMWSEQLDAFPSHRVLAVDLRGFGRSPVTSGTVSMEQMADDLAAELNALSIAQPVVLCGLSMGGYVAWQFWRRHARRLAALILCDTRAKADTPEAVAARMKMVESVLRSGPEPVAEAMLPKLFAPETRTRHPQRIEVIRRAMLATQPEGIAAALRGMAARPDVTSWLGQIDLPALVVVGEHDTISPVAEMRELAMALPQAEFAVIPEAGHMSPLENPAAFNPLVAKFLERVAQ